MNPLNVIDILSNLITDRLTLSSNVQNTKNDREIAELLFDNVQSIFQSTFYKVETEDTLDIGSENKKTIDSLVSTEETDTLSNMEIESSDENISDLDDSYCNDEASTSIEKNTFSIEYMENVISYYDQFDEITGQRRISFASVQRRFKRVTHKNYITRFRQYLEKHGTKYQKLEEIDAFVYDAFKSAREKLLSVHDIDLRKWGLRKATEIMIDDFVASDFWIYQFKKKHSIVSRKITKLVTTREFHDQDSINQSAYNFVDDTRKVMRNYNPDLILNTDQSGLQLEMYCKRTLSYQGEKLTLATVKSINNTTHSYTVQPIISMSGRLIGPLFLCLKEESGKIGELAKRTLLQPANIVLTCSKSGKLTSSLVEYWRDHVLRPTIKNNKCLLLSDCWGAQGGKDLYEALSNLTRLEIPKKTTGIIQPLDVYFNRQYKIISRRLYDHVRLHEIDINLAQRNNIIKINSLIHNQLSAPVFHSMIKYAWFKSGYLQDDPGDFLNVKNVCFTYKSNTCSVHNCKQFTFIHCSWCSQSFCITHFFC